MSLAKKLNTIYACTSKKYKKRQYNNESFRFISKWLLYETKVTYVFL